MDCLSNRQVLNSFKEFIFSESPLSANTFDPTLAASCGRPSEYDTYPILSPV